METSKKAFIWPWVGSWTKNMVYMGPWDGYWVGTGIVPQAPTQSRTTPGTPPLPARLDHASTPAAR